MSTAQLRRLVRVASGRDPADLVVTNAHIVDVFALRILRGSVAIVDGTIAGIAPTYHGAREIDVDGGYLIPGLIDAHVHIESALTTPARFAELVLPLGTTTVIADPHEIANVAGEAGVTFMRDDARRVPLEVKLMVPSCVPAMEGEHAGATLPANAVASLLECEGVHGLGEVMDVPAVLAAHPEILSKIDAAHARRMPVDGHAPMVGGRDLDAYAAAGITTDHECSTVREALERISRGMYVLLRHGSAAKNLKHLLPVVNAATLPRLLMCSDDKEPWEIEAEGHMNANVRLAIAGGIDPLWAIRMATLNPAEAYRLYDRGAIAPGRIADLCVVRDLTTMAVERTFKNGVEVAHFGTPRFSVAKAASVPSRLTSSVRLAPRAEGCFDLPLVHPPQRRATARVIRCAAGSLLTESLVRDLPVDARGTYRPTGAGMPAKIAVLERHRGSSAISVGLILGLPITGGAIASTVAHDSHNLIVVGDNDGDMHRAVDHLEAIGGGMVAVANGEVLADLPSPSGGSSPPTRSPKRSRASGGSCSLPSNGWASTKPTPPS